ncbi:MAG: c-type cytochrome [Candidatus Nitrosoglobus sp.]
MMLKCFAVAAACILFAASSSAALVAGDPEAGKAKTTPCQSCHGPDGNSPNPEWPNLAGQNASYLKKQLQDFKSGARKNPIMSSIAAALSDEDIANLAVYYSSQTISEGTTPEEYFKLGQDLFRQGDKESGVPACMACHGPSGDGNPAAAWPRLSGQNAKYVENQLKAYRSSERTNDLNKMMQGVAKKITDEEITAISHYVSGLRIAH